MENASKALIIAGAILISIVLVTVGVMVVNSLSPDTALDEMTKQEVTTFNSKFEGAAGNSVQGSKVRSLISNVITNNAGLNDSEEKFIKVNMNGTEIIDANNLSAERNKVNSSHKYNVTVQYDSKSGLVNHITIVELTGNN